VTSPTEQILGHRLAMLAKLIHSWAKTASFLVDLDIDLQLDRFKHEPTVTNLALGGHLGLLYQSSIIKGWALVG